jgi:hypothetical protein
MIVDVLVCGELCSGGGVGMGFRERAEDEAGVNYEIILLSEFLKNDEVEGTYSLQHRAEDVP